MKPVAALALFALAGCGGGPDPDWTRQLAEVRAGRQTTIDLSRGRVAPADLRGLAEGCDRLTALSLRRNSPGPPVCTREDFTPALAAVLPALPDLERLDLDGPVDLSELGVAEPRLNVVHLNLPAAAADDADAAALVAAFPELTALRLHAPGLTGQGADSIRHLIELRTLHLIGAPLKDSAVLGLAEMSELTSLYLDGAILSRNLRQWLGRRSGLHVHLDGGH